MKFEWKEPLIQIIGLNVADVLADSPDEVDDCEWDLFD